MRFAIPSDYREKVASLVGDEVESWDTRGKIPSPTLSELGSAGLLCSQVPAKYGGLGCDSRLTGELTAYIGSICSSVRSIVTSQGMAAWTIQRLGNEQQREEYLDALTAGSLAAMAFTEVDAGSDLAAIKTEVHYVGGGIALNGEKVWVTGACYADLLIVVGRLSNGEAVAIAVPAMTDGVDIDPVSQPLGCRAAGHANIRFRDVHLPVTSVLGECGHAMSSLVTTSLTFGRLSVAWGCVGILRGCLKAASTHARFRHQFGRPISDYQLILRHLAMLVALENVSTQVCQNASTNWDSNRSSVAFDAVLAKYISARAAADGASTAVQILASAGASDGHLVARAYRDAKLMEIIEGSNEICELLLAEHALRPLTDTGGDL